MYSDPNIYFNSFDGYFHIRGIHQQFITEEDALEYIEEHLQ